MITVTLNWNFTVDLDVSVSVTHCSTYRHENIFPPKSDFRNIKKRSVSSSLSYT